MPLEEYFDTPKHAAEVEQRMRQLGWRWYCYAFAGACFAQSVNSSRNDRIHPTRDADGPWEWHNHWVFVKAGGAKFPDPVSCAIAWELLE